MAKFHDTLESFQAADRQAWRDWLQENHDTSKGVWLVYYKVGTGKPSVTHPEAVQEALCFGWIDSKVQSIDEERYRQLFTPRKPGSIWSLLNKQHVAQMVEQGLMSPAGLEKIEAAKADGSWAFLDAIDALIVPDDLAQALELDEEAHSHFQAFSDSDKKRILYWIATAKRPQTRANRIAKAVEAARESRLPVSGP